MNDIATNWIFAVSISTILIFLLATLYYLITLKKILSRPLQRLTGNRLSGEEADFLIDKLSGFVLFGVIIYVLYRLIPGFSEINAGLTRGRIAEFWYLILICSVIALLVSYFSSKSPRTRNISPAIKNRNWHQRQLFLTLLGWSFYLFGYEFMLRGFLWFLCYKFTGFWPAVIINIAVYSLIHIPKGKILVLGSIPAGLVFCLLSFLTGSFLPAFIVHVTMSVSSDLFSVINNPEFKLEMGRETGKL